MGDKIDFIYYSMRSAMVESYCNGDFDNSYNQLELSIQMLDKFYKSRHFVGLNVEQVEDKKRELLTQVQMETDKRMGVFNGFTS